MGLQRVRHNWASLQAYVYISIYISIYISHFLFICSVVSGHLGCYLFHVLAIVNSTAMTTRVHVPFKIKVFSRYGPRSEIAGQFGNSNFSFLRNLNTVFHSGCTQLPFHPFPFSPHPLQQLLLIDFLTMVILTVWRWYLTVVLICISLIISECWASFHVPIGCLLQIKVCLSLLPVFPLDCLLCCYWAVCIFWKVGPCQSHHLQIFFPVYRLSFHFIYCFLCYAKAYMLN